MNYVYIMTNQKNGTLYIGVTSNLMKRLEQHKLGLVEGFTKKHALYIVVYLEPYEDIRTAIQREKQIKKWNRQWKINLIEAMNPYWHDLAKQV